MRWVWLAPLVMVASRAAADDACHVVDIAFTPTDYLQIVAWVEKPDGTYVDTIYVTRKTGSLGLGNRPGRFDFNSGPSPDTGHDDMWPYGRRTTTFPVWAHRHGMTFPEVDFQVFDPNTMVHRCCGDESHLSNPADQSSIESAYCRPLSAMNDTQLWDAGTCATTAFTDKGIFNDQGVTSLYPPRADLVRDPKPDSPSVDLYRMMNPFDAVSQPTPIGGSCAQINWPIPTALPVGNYVLWLEASKAFDMNASYNDTVFPAPTGIPYASYGKPYRGQPSVVYSVPFTIGPGETSVATQSYAGYGAPDGADGTLRPPDPTITTDTPGSGASRLMMIAGSADRVRVHVRETSDAIAPGAPTGLAPVKITSTTATLQFAAPGDDGQTGAVSSYEIRLSADAEMTADTFAAAQEVKTTVTPGSSGECGVQGGFPPAGSTQTFELDGLLPYTDYWIGIRAYDKCHNAGDIAIAKLTTLDRQSGEVSACFIATAAYGSAMANDVELLRHFRDFVLRSTALGEIAVETYYTFSPPVARVVGESELLREAARDLLRPVIARIR